MVNVSFTGGQVAYLAEKGKQRKLPASTMSEGVNKVAAVACLMADE